MKIIERIKEDGISLRTVYILSAGSAEMNSWFLWFIRMRARAG